MRAPDPSIGIPPPGHRLPAGLRLGPVRLQVSDLPRSVEFYRRVIGLRTLAADGPRATLAAHGDAAPVVELTERPGAAPVPPGGRQGLFHYAILLPDRPALGRFAAHLRETGVRAGASDHLVSEALYLSDPDGLGIEVYADRPRAAWGRAGREIAMDTRPLDLADVIRAAGGAPWRGMPPGTGIGHVHLHVGDLARADAFYHAALGLDRVVWSYPGALFLSAGGYHHHLGVNTWAAGAASAGEDDARLLEWEIVLPSADDLRATVRSLEDAGHAVDHDQDAAVVRDPWGTALRLRVEDV